MTNPDITLSPVKSSNVESVGFCSATNRLAVRFKAGGKTYIYADVEPSLHADLLAAPSIGKFVGSNVVGKFQHTVMQAPQKAAP
ncbi:MAG: KTSC domain-containing protein [Pseudomonadota bacterium]